jgi:uncharacterized protein
VSGTQQNAGLIDAPVAEAGRIETLDVLRGFALLGILLLNILGFGLHTAGYFNPQFGAGTNPGLNLAVWGSMDVLFEGSMRALFSILFGAGVVLFTTGARGKSGTLHYRRTFWLLMFGVFDAFILLWTGDILIVYALAGFVLYLLRNRTARFLYIAAGVLVVLSSLEYGAMNAGLSFARAQSDIVAERGDAASQQAQELDVVWRDFRAIAEPSAEQIKSELEARRSSYTTAFTWSAVHMAELLAFAVPTFLFWDALAMMMLGMALYKSGILQGEGTGDGPWIRLTVGGFAIGLLVNGFEVVGAMASGFDIMAYFGFAQWTYPFGRLGMALGYLGLVVLICRTGFWSGVRNALAATGRMALTNYLMQSLICLVLFTGAGFALVGKFERWELYLVVLGIWVFQLAGSVFWLRRFSYGPAEWLWRALTYLRLPAMRRVG